MQLALEFFLIGKLAASSQHAVLRRDMDGIGTRRLDRPANQPAICPRAARAAEIPEAKPSR